MIPIIRMALVSLIASAITRIPAAKGFQTAIVPLRSMSATALAMASTRGLEVRREGATPTGETVALKKEELEYSLSQYLLHSTVFYLFDCLWIFLSFFDFLTNRLTSLI